MPCEILVRLGGARLEQQAQAQQQAQRDAEALYYLTHLKK